MELCTQRTCSDFVYISLDSTGNLSHPQDARSRKINTKCNGRSDGGWKIYAAGKYNHSIDIWLLAAKCLNDYTTSQVVLV